jgi:hypothetical protein
MTQQLDDAGDVLPGGLSHVPQAHYPIPPDIRVRVLQQFAQAGHLLPDIHTGLTQGLQGLRREHPDMPVRVFQRLAQAGHLRPGALTQPPQGLRRGPANTRVRVSQGPAQTGYLLWNNELAHEPQGLHCGAADTRVRISQRLAQARHLLPAPLAQPPQGHHRFMTGELVRLLQQHVHEAGGLLPGGPAHAPQDARRGLTDPWHRILQQLAQTGGLLPGRRAHLLQGRLRSSPGLGNGGSPLLLQHLVDEAGGLLPGGLAHPPQGSRLHLLQRVIRLPHHHVDEARGELRGGLSQGRPGDDDGLPERPVSRAQGPRRAWRLDEGNEPLADPGNAIHEPVQHHQGLGHHLVLGVFQGREQTSGNSLVGG